MKGRKPKDLALKLLTGNPGHRPMGGTSDAPFLAAKFPKPDGLSEDASREWDRLVETLAGILSPAAAGMVYVAATAYGRMRRAEYLLAEAGGELYETTGKSGRMVREHPAQGMLERSSTAYHRALAELGSTPVGHTRVKKLPEDGQTELPGMGRLLG